MLYYTQNIYVVNIISMFCQNYSLSQNVIKFKTKY